MFDDKGNSARYLQRCCCAGRSFPTEADSWVAESVMSSTCPALHDLLTGDAHQDHA